MNLEDKIIEKLKDVNDPELDLDIYTLGLVYKIENDEDGVIITMTLTSPFCPFADELIQNVEKTVGTLPELKDKDVRVEITFEPAWEPSAELRSALGI